MFDSIHLHLMLNHAPLFLALCGALLALAGEAMNERWLRRAGLAAMLIAGPLAWAVSASGERAGETLEKLRPASEALIETHEEAAEAATPVFAFAAVVAAVALALERKPRGVRVATLLAGALGVAAFALAARAALLGGKISHPELTPGGAAPAAAPAPVSGPEKEHDRD